MREKKEEEGKKIAGALSCLPKRNGFDYDGPNELSVIKRTKKIHIYIYKFFQNKEKIHSSRNKKRDQENEDTREHFEQRSRLGESLLVSPLSHSRTRLCHDNISG